MSPTEKNLFDYFEPFPENADPGEYRIIPIEKLIPSKTTEAENPEGLAPSVAKALGYIRALDEKRPEARRRKPLDAVELDDGTFSVVDGNAALTAHRMLGRTALPVRVLNAKEL